MTLAPLGCCEKCDRPMRRQKDDASDHPGTVQKATAQLCGACYARNRPTRRNHFKPPAEPKARQRTSTNHLPVDDIMRGLIRDAVDAVVGGENVTERLRNTQMEGGLMSGMVQS